jgi:hypothetical protein
MESKKQMPHLGSMIDSLMYKKGFNRASLAREINKSPITVYGYTSEPSLHARILWDISQALHYDIFEHLSNNLDLENTTTDGIQPKTKKQKIEELELQVRDLQKEVAIYKDLLKR